MEPLVVLPVEKWNALKAKLLTLWPLNVAGFYALYLNFEYPRVREAFEFKVYCPFGDMSNGFVAINVKPGGSQDVIIFSTSRDTSKLERALVSTKLINWTEKVCIDLVSSLILKVLDRIKQDLGFKLYNVGIAKTFFLDKKTRRFKNLCWPPNTHIDSIKECHLKRIDDVWPHKYPGSLEYFTILATNGLSFGLYHQEKLVTWVFLNEYFFLCHLYCEEKYRRLGYAETLLKHVINEQLELENDLYAYVVEGNDKPIRLFEKLGFVDVDKGAWLYVQK